MVEPKLQGREPVEAEPVVEAEHGAIELGEMRRRGIDPDCVLDFSTNVQPFGPSPRVREAVWAAALDRYPDRDCLRLREAISESIDVPLARILAGNGCSELLQSLVQVLVQPGDLALILGPTYAEYARASRLAGARIDEVRATTDSQFAVPVSDFEKSLAERSPKIAFLCNPNNPTGQLIDAERILAWVARFQSTHFIVDESYMDFVEQPSSATRHRARNLTVLTSMTKTYALAGLRVGYAVADPSVVRELCRRRVPWSVSTPAQAAGVAALKDCSYLQPVLMRLRAAKRELFDGLRFQGWKPLASTTNFLLLPVGDAHALRDRLLSEHLLVRDCRSFGILGHIRIGVRSPDDNQRLLASLSAQQPL